jgi:ribose 5-phosphate isomerase B
LVNKIPGIRAIICYDSYSTRQGVEHDDMDVLWTSVGSSLAMETIDAFLAAKYEPGERHARMLDKVLEIEAKGLGIL